MEWTIRLEVMTGWGEVETVGGVFQVREDEPEPRVGVGLHGTP